MSIQLQTLYYFRVDWANKDIAQTIGIKQDRRGDWYLPQYNTSGAGFERKYLEAMQVFGDPYKTVRL